MPAHGLAGQVALVTGGSRGIGRATVARLCAEGAGVAFCGRDAEACQATAAEMRALGFRVEAFTCDVADEDDVRRFVEGARERLGPASILVNNAGVNANFDAATMTGKEWDDFFAVDLKSAWLTVKYAVDDMKRAGGGGAIVNVSSLHGYATMPGFFPYAAAKSGLIGLTRSMALDLGPHGIRVNCIAPGFIRTRLVQDSIDRAPDRLAAERRMTAALALGRIGEPEEIADVVFFFASPLSSYVTGASLIVDGGLTARRAG